MDGIFFYIKNLSGLHVSSILFHKTFLINAYFHDKDEELIPQLNC